MKIPPLPEGYTLDNQNLMENIPPLPPGFVLDKKENLDVAKKYEGLYKPGDIISKQEKIPAQVGAFGQAALKGATLGFSEKVLPYISAGAAKLMGGEATADIPYSELVEASKDIRGQQEQFYEEEYPKTSLLGEIGGAIASPVGMKISKTLGGGVKGLVGGGAIEGAITGVGYGEDLTNIPQTAKDAAIGAVAGGAFGGALYGTGKAVKKTAELAKKPISKFTNKEKFTANKIKQTLKKEGVDIKETLDKMDIEGLNLIDVLDQRSNLVSTLPKKVYEKATIDTIDNYTNNLNKYAIGAKDEVLDLVSKRKITDDEAANIIGENAVEAIKRQKDIRTSKAKPLYLKAFSSDVEQIPYGLNQKDLEGMLNSVKHPPPKPKNLTQFVKEKGGIDTTLPAFSGELKSSDITNRTRPGIVNHKTGKSIDDMALSAWEEGYIPGDERPDASVFLDYLNDDFATKSIFKLEDRGYMGDMEYINDSQQLLDELGISKKSDIEQYSKRKIKTAVEKEDPFLKIPAIKEAIKKAKQESKRFGKETFGSLEGYPDNSLLVLHQAKEYLFKKSKDFTDLQQARYGKLYEELSTKLKNSSKEYEQATKSWKGDTEGLQELYKQKGIGNIARSYEKNDIDAVKRNLKNFFEKTITDEEISRIKRNTKPEDFDAIVRKHLETQIEKTNDAGTNFSDTIFGKGSEAGLKSKRLELLFDKNEQEGLARFADIFDKATDRTKLKKGVRFDGLPEGKTFLHGGKFAFLNNVLNLVQKIAENPKEREFFVNYLTTSEGRDLLKKISKQKDINWDNIINTIERGATRVATTQLQEVSE